MTILNLSFVQLVLVSLDESVKLRGLALGWARRRLRILLQRATGSVNDVALELNLLDERALVTKVEKGGLGRVIGS